jgi:uncharacterized membrane protein YfcA
MEVSWILVGLFFLVAILYSSVGFGGGSSYLALMVLAGVDTYLLRSTALMCNILVVTGGCWIFYKAGLLNLRKIIPIIVFSIPMAFLGGLWPISERVLLILLGISLIIASILMWKKPVKRLETSEYSISHVRTGVIGGGVGLLSGLVGIGGGIFLSPVLNLFKWDSPKVIAATASFFILVNSIAGLAGQWIQYSPQIDLAWSWPLLVAVLAGGQIGSRISVLKFDQLTVRRVTALVIFIAGFRILWDQIMPLI